MAGWLGSLSDCNKCTGYVLHAVSRNFDSKRIPRSVIRRVLFSGRDSLPEIFLTVLRARSVYKSQPRGLQRRGLVIRRVHCVTLARICRRFWYKETLRPRAGMIFSYGHSIFRSIICFFFQFINSISFAPIRMLETRNAFTEIFQLFLIENAQKHCLSKQQASKQNRIFEFLNFDCIRIL